MAFVRHFNDSDVTCHALYVQHSVHEQVIGHRRTWMAPSKRKTTAKFWKKMSSSLLNTLTLASSAPSNKTTTSDTHQKWPRNGSRTMMSMWWTGPVRLQTSVPLKICGENCSLRWGRESLRISKIWRRLQRKNGPNCQWIRAKNLSRIKDTFWRWWWKKKQRTWYWLLKVGYE